MIFGFTIGEIVKLVILGAGAFYLTVNCRITYDQSKWQWLVKQ